MIRNFKPNPHIEPENYFPFQWLPAIGAGLIAGIVLLVLPRGNPWSALTFFSPTILGRVVPADWETHWVVAATIHLAISLVYGLIIGRAVAHVTQFRAVIVGSLVGVVLYIVNFLAFSLVARGLIGNEFSVLFAHLVFGAIAGGAYRGLLRREPVAHPPQSSP
jgi:hypothetical protein